MRTSPESRVLSSSQLALIAEHGEERTAEVGETLFEIGDATYPFIAILEGEAAVLDAAGQEIVRHGASGFLGEINLLSGQTVFLTAEVTEPMRYIAVEREQLRDLLFEDPALSDLLLTAFVERRELLQQRQGVGLEYRRRAIRRTLAGWSISPARAAAPLLGRPAARDGADGGRRAAARPRSCGSRAGSSCTTRATASSRARSASGSSSRRARRSTC